MPAQYISGEETIAQIRAETDTVMLSFSAGKDSVGAWIALRRAGLQVRPYYMYLVPGLSFIEASLSYYENFFGERIVRVPNPALYRMLNNGVFQSPERMEIIRDCRLPNFKFDSLRDWVAANDFGLPARTWTATGVREADNLARRRAIHSLGGGINGNRRLFYPIFDWLVGRLEDEIITAACKLPRDYDLFGRSFDGLDYRYLHPIREHFPEDFERIKEWFPLCETEFHRHPKYGHQPTQDRHHPTPTTEGFARETASP